MSVKLHEAFSMDSFMDRLLFWDDFHGDQLQDEWNEAGQAGGSAVVVDAQTGGIVRITTDVDTNDGWRIDWADIRSLHIDKKVTLEIRAKLNHITYLRADLAIRFDFNNQVEFTFNEAVGGAINWSIATHNAGVTTQDSGVTIDTDYHIYRIECFPTDEVHFYIDGVETTNSPITTNIPDDAADFLQPYLFIQTREDLAKSMDIDYVYIRQERT